jgi:pyridoxine 4-dehydrogenase
MPAKTLTLGGREVARIGLGTNRLTHTPEHVEFARQAVAAGIGHIDTAHLYTDGQSEQVLGEALPGPRDDVLIATKGGYGGAGRGRPDALRAEIEESLRRLRTEVIDLYYLHRIDPETPVEESLGAIEEYRQAGQIRHVGISEVGIEELERARQVLPIAAVQNRYNLADRAHDEVIDHCAREGIAFVAYFPLRADPPKAAGEIAARHQATPSQVTLAWLLRRSPALAAIPGTLSLEHLRENLAALDLELSDAEFEALGGG